MGDFSVSLKSRRSLNVLKFCRMNSQGNNAFMLLIFRNRSNDSVIFLRTLRGNTQKSNIYCL